MVSSDTPAANRIQLQVWLGEVGVPAAGAEVFALQGLQVASTLSPWAACIEAEDRGVRYVAASDGTASWDAGPGAVAIAARLPGCFGALTIAPGDAREVAVVLVPDLAVTVRVLDEGEQPVAGAPVALNQRVPVVVGMEWAYEEMAALEREIAELLEQMRQSTSEQVRKERAPDLRKMKTELVRVERRAAGRRGGRGASPGVARR